MKSYKGKRYELAVKAVMRAEIRVEILVDLLAYHEEQTRFRLHHARNQLEKRRAQAQKLYSTLP